MVIDMVMVIDLTWLLIQTMYILRRDYLSIPVGKLINPLSFALKITLLLKLT